MTDQRPVTVHLAFLIGEVVVLKINEDREPGMITGVLMRPDGLFYFVTWADGEETTHWEIELEKRDDEE